MALYVHCRKRPNKEGEKVVYSFDHRPQFWGVVTEIRWGGNEMTIVVMGVSRVGMREGYRRGNVFLNETWNRGYRWIRRVE